MGRRLPTRMYRRGFAGRSVQYERSYRLAQAEMIKGMKPRRGPYRRVTTLPWWLPSAKAIPKR